MCEEQVVQLALGNAMAGVEYMAATRLKSWAFEYVRDEIFGEMLDTQSVPC